MLNKKTLRKVMEIITPYNLRAEMLPGIFSVGVAGDNRTYTPVINLIGPFPGHEKLAELSTRISNVTPICRITFQLTTNK
jgi:hypothetical protein